MPNRPAKNPRSDRRPARAPRTPKDRRPPDIKTTPESVAIYLRGFPRDMADRLRGLAAQRRTTMARLIADAVRRCFPP